MKNKAFTLAETLIVIGIIGVVAALTLPNLNHATGDKEKVTRVKKIYSSLTDAFNRAQVVYGPYDEWFKNDTTDEQRANRIGERLAEFLKVSKNCKMESGKGCSIKDSYTNYYKFELADGTGVAVDYITAYVDGPTGFITVDIDGKKGRSWNGVDVFSFYITNNNNIHDIDPGTIDWLGSGIFGHSHWGSTRWIIDYGNMDYSKADDTGKCPNGVQLSETQTSCN